MTDTELENFPTSESAKRMLSYVSAGFYDKSYVGKWLYQVMGLEYDDARKLVEELSLQMFPETATWGLMYHEIKWGLPVRENLDYEVRRREIYKKRDLRAPMTPYRMEQNLKDATGFDVCISDAHDNGERGFIPDHPNIFKAIFMGDGTLDVKKAKKTLDEMKQSHTTFTMMDWVRWILDNRDLEQFTKYRLKMSTAISFWGLPMWDGTHLMDGSIRLDGIGRYNLIPGIKYNQGEFETVENTDNYRLRIKEAAAEVSERVDTARAVFLWAIKNYACLIFDGSVLMDGKRLLDVCRQVVNPTAKVRTSIENEETAKGRLITTRNLAYFNGSYKMDGTRVLNSIYREEAL